MPAKNSTAPLCAHTSHTPTSHLTQSELDELRDLYSQLDETDRKFVSGLIHFLLKAKEEGVGE